MKKRAIVVMVCAICFVASFVGMGCFGLTSTGIMDRMYVSQSKQLVIGVNEDLAPMAFVDETGAYTGFDIDYAREICRRMGVQPKFVSVPPNQEFSYLQTGKVACYWSGFPNEQKLPDNIISSPVYLESDQVILYLSEQNFETLVDLEGATVAVRKNSAADYELKQSQLFRNSLQGIVETESNTQSIQQLKSHKVQAVILDQETAVYYQKQEPGQYRLLSKQDETIQTVGTSGYVVLFSGGNEEEIKFVEQTIEQAEQDGVRNQLEQRWFSSESVL